MLLNALAAMPLATLFLVIALGAVLSRVHVRGVGLGIASVLFAALAVGAWGGGRFELPPIVGQLGLVLFVYAIGLETGRPFFHMAQRRGLVLTLLVVVTLLLVALPTWLSVHWLGISPAMAVGMFCGASTNTPALSALSDLVIGKPEATYPTVGYALAYPLGVLVPLLIAELSLRLSGANLDADVRRAEADAGLALDPPVAVNLVVATPETAGHSLETTPLAELPVRVSRVSHQGHVLVPTPETRLEEGDVVHIVGSQEAIEAASHVVGPLAQGVAGPEESRTEVDFRRIILSRRRFAGRRVDDLDFEPDWGAVVTRVRRGDLDFVPTAATRLEQGDRLRVVARAEHMNAVSKHLGDSFRALGELDLLPLALGLSAGMLIGAIKIALPGGLSLQLGAAGGPLLVALVLGALGRTGPLLWRLPSASSLALRQLGLVIFFSSVGLRAGHQFAAALTGTQGPLLIAMGAAATLLATLTLLGTAVLLLRLDWVSALGILAGGQTQPALLAYAEERCHGELPDIGYASIFPIATVGKIVAAQVLLAWLNSHTP